jgi:ATP-dependent Lhr-like helicase
MRFLFRWQHLLPNDRREGPDALDAVISQLQGFEAPVAAWETEVLPARLEGYDMTWLDDLCLSGRTVWARLTPPAAAATGHAGPIRTTPVALLPRRAAAAWHRVAPATAPSAVNVSARAQRVIEHLRLHGASFYDEIVEGTGLLRTQVEEALAELVAFGIATSDSFAGLRALLTPSEKRAPFGGGRRHRRALSGIEEAGRWSLRRRETPSGAAPRGNVEADAESAEHVVRALLRRYGVVFWRILQREAGWLPPWRDLLRVLRRLEARGEIRGGRFVASVSGEQFALPEAVQTLRDTRRAPLTGDWVAVSGADPLNLVGTLLPGSKVAALTGNRILYRDGSPVGALVGGELQWLDRIDIECMRIAEDMLIRRRAGAPLLATVR